MINQGISPECLFYLELYGELNELTKCHHIPPPGGLGPKNKIWVILVKMTYQASSPEPM